MENSATKRIIINGILTNGLSHQRNPPMIASQTLETLEFPKIREQLARHTAFSASRELALELLPSTDQQAIERNLALTSEARALIDALPDANVGGARDIRNAARHAARGAMLDGNVLLEVASTLYSMRRLRTLLIKIAPATYPLLYDYGESLPVLQVIEDAIGRAIGDDGLVLDSASPELARLRREIRGAFARLQERLQSMISSSELAGALQESLITVRNGRYVIPVKAAQRRSVRGLVHDQSGSGATLYIEPLAIVELNNRWRELQFAEEEEINRILAELSGLVGGASTAIVLGVETTALVDLAFAKARYATALRCVAPSIIKGAASANDAPPFLLREARHPLLDPARVVPITIELGATFRLLLITGPNTGGKTVALKTTGLLALMAQAGMHIPASAPSRLPIFDQIFADIGDEQSIEQSLSTFSSHMTNIIRILRTLNAIAETAPTSGHLSALVLLDELGAGTDPVEGAALARAIVERLLDQGCLGVATTHYAELKAFAYNTPGVQNGSVEFDVETLAPTYRLTIGLPGRSNALAIANRLGLDTAIVERARATMAREDAQVEDLLAGIHREREAAQTELRRTEELRTDAEKYRDRLAHEWREFEENRESRRSQVEHDLEEELREIRGQLHRLRDEFRSVSLSRQWLDEAEQRLQSTRQESNAALERVRTKPHVVPVMPMPPTMPPAPVPQPPRPLQVGDNVLVRSVGLNGEIVAIDEEDQMADVQIGGFRMRVGLDELRRVKPNPEEERRTRYREQRAITVSSTPDVSMTFDMRGWRAGEVNDRLDHYINDAYLAGLPQVRLVHGKGSGTLRQIVREMLRQHPLVASFTAGGNDGGDGVTIAKLVER